MPTTTFPKRPDETAIEKFAGLDSNSYVYALRQKAINVSNAKIKSSKLRWARERVDSTEDSPSANSTVSSVNGISGMADRLIQGIKGNISEIEAIIDHLSAHWDRYTPADKRSISALVGNYSHTINYRSYVPKVYDSLFMYRAVVNRFYTDSLTQRNKALTQVANDLYGLALKSDFTPRVIVTSPRGRSPYPVSTGSPGNSTPSTPAPTRPSSARITLS